MTKLSKEAMREYMKERRRKEKLGMLVTDIVGAQQRGMQTKESAGTDRAVREKEEVVEVSLGTDSVVVHEKWDKDRYPVKAAWDIAVARSVRARRYALLFPNMIGPDERKFQEIAWQYENEGLKAVKPKEAYVVK